jgi:hypothetical protein
MLAYLFWHRAADGVAAEAYEWAIIRFHRSLAAHPPVGFVRSVCLRAPALTWLGGEDGYEDWYVVEDFAAIGILNEAAVGRRHLTAHDEAARRAGPGTGAIFRLLEGAATPALARVAVWVDKPRGVESPMLAALLGDGLDATHAGLWQRQLSLGPAPEYCVLAAEVPAGVATTRLARGWSAITAAREPL